MAHVCRKLTAIDRLSLPCSTGILLKHSALQTHSSSRASCPLSIHLVFGGFLVCRYRILRIVYNPELSLDVVGVKLGIAVPVLLKAGNRLQLCFRVQQFLDFLERSPVTCSAHVVSHFVRSRCLPLYFKCSYYKNFSLHRI